MLEFVEDGGFAIGIKAEAASEIVLRSRERETEAPSRSRYIPLPVPSGSAENSSV